MSKNKMFHNRIQNDIKEFYKDNPEGMHVVARDDDITVIHALIQGPDGTPYQKGLFYFVVNFPNQYPIKPPKVKLMTTGGNKVRFNPNLYCNGKVCLSILGTWSGPSWSPAQTLLSTLISIRSLMNEKPYHNEPGHEEEKVGNGNKVKKDVDNYNEMIMHETIRVAAIAMVEDKNGDACNMPQELKDVMIHCFRNNYNFYEQFVRSKLSLDGTPIVDPFNDPNRPKIFQYQDLLDKLLKLKDQFQITESFDSNVQTVDSYKQVMDKTLLSETNKQKANDNPDDWSDVFIDAPDATDLVYVSDDTDSDIEVICEKKNKKSM